MKQRIFISCVQKEFAQERQALKAYILGDALLSRFFDVFLFEDIPAKDRRADELYLDEVEKASIYIGIFGNEYGLPGKKGLSPTHMEFLRATELQKQRLIFIKGADDSQRKPPMKALIKEAATQLVRRRFATTSELISGVYVSLIDYLADKGLLRFGPFDASICDEAGLHDISSAKVQWFLEMARASRDFPLKAGTAIKTILSHLRLIKDNKPTNAAILLFGKEPQRFIYSSEVKCAHFHGTQVQKPIPSYQVYKGNLFELVDQSVSFVLSKINLAVGTRAESSQAPVAYEMPPEVIREAIVNAVAHRDYTSTASVQVMLFADRLEVWNPGELPPALTLKTLLKPHGSYPRNPLVAELLYLTKYIERMGTGIRDMVERCRAVGLSAPQFTLTDGFVITIKRKPDLAFKAVGGTTGEVAGEVTGEVKRLLAVLKGDMKRTEIQAALALKHEDYFREAYLNPALNSGLIEMTVPEKPKSSKQKYRLTEKGKSMLKNLRKKDVNK